MPHFVNVQVVGIQFPPQCPACGGEGAVTVPIVKAFPPRTEDEEEREGVVSFNISFCESCALRHAKEQRRPGIIDHLRRLCSNPGNALGATIVGVIGLFFIREALAKLSLALFVFSLLPIGIALWLLRLNWNLQPSKFLPPPTSVTASVDFGEYASKEFEPLWLQFSFQSDGYARAFRELNAARLWDPGGGVAMAARQKRAWKEKRNQWAYWIFAGFVLLLSLVSWLMGWDS